MLGGRSEKLIVVLSGGYTNDPRIPADSLLGEDTLARVVKGVQLYRAMPGSKVILSGGELNGTVPAPTDYLARRNLNLSADDVYPTAEGIRIAEGAVYECLGLVWAKLRGKIQFPEAP